MEYKRELRQQHEYFDLEGVANKVTSTEDEMSDVTVISEVYEYKNLVVNVVSRKIWNLSWEFAYVFKIDGKITGVFNSGNAARDMFYTYQMYLNPYDY